MHPSPAELIKSLSVPLYPLPVLIDRKLKGKDGAAIRAVIFDIYGTLFISEAGDISLSVNKSTAEVFLKTFSMCGIKGFSTEADAGELGKRFYSEISLKHEAEKGKGNFTPEVDIREIWDKTLKSFGIKKAEKDIEEIALVFEVFSNKTWPMPHLGEILSLIFKKGIIMGIISNAQFYTEYLFEAHLGSPASRLGFNSSLCYYSYAHGTAKPGRTMFIKASEYLLTEKGIAAAETLYIGNDVLNDMKPASETGMRTCLFAGDRRSLRLRDDNSGLSGFRPDYTITGLCDLKAILDL